MSVSSAAVFQSPKDDIPKGTFTAIGITGVTYSFLAVLMAGSVQRDAGGYVWGTEANATTLMYNGTTMMYNETTMMDNWRMTTNAEGALNGTEEARPPVWLYNGPDSYCIPGKSCRYGLQNDMAVSTYC